jgi:maltose O-acetyltransferase
MNKVKRAFFYLLYYGVARYLPRSYELSFLGRLAHKLRRFASRPLFKECGLNFHVERMADFGSGSCVFLDECACIGENNRFIGRGEIRIGRHAMLGPDVMLISENHKYRAESFDGYDIGNIIIGEYAWIGARAIILKGVKIGKYAIVGAGAVVVSKVPDYAIVMGNPARVIKYRNSGSMFM